MRQTDRLMDKQFEKALATDIRTHLRQTGRHKDTIETGRHKNTFETGRHKETFETDRQTDIKTHLRLTDRQT